MGTPDLRQLKKIAFRFTKRSIQQPRRALPLSQVHRSSPRVPDLVCPLLRRVLLASSRRLSQAGCDAGVILKFSFCHVFSLLDPATYLTPCVVRGEGWGWPLALFEASPSPGISKVPVPGGRGLRGTDLDVRGGFAYGHRCPLD